MIALLCWDSLKGFKSTPVLSYIQLQNVLIQNSRYGMMNNRWIGDRFQSVGQALFISVAVVLGACGWRWCAAVPLMSWWRQCHSPQPSCTGFYLLLSQVSQPGTEHLKEALTLFWIRLTWFMWLGVDLCPCSGAASFMSGCLWEYGDGFLCARGCSLKQRYDLGLGLIPDESESTSRWISCSALNTHKNMVHKAPHLGNRKEFESRLILWTVIFPRRHLHAPGITGLWGDYRQGKRGYKSKKLFIFIQGSRAHT